MQLNRLIFVFLCLLMPLVTDAYASIIVNGSFEHPVVPVGTYQNFIAGSTAITGWTVVGIDSAVVNTRYSQNGITFNSQDGNQYLDLAGVNSNSTSSGVTQTISTLVGVNYLVSFYVGSATDNFQHFPSTVDLTIDGGPRIGYTNPNAPTTNVDWKLFTVPFTAQSTTTTLTFQNGSASNNYLGALDNVSVTVSAVSAVPEPSSFAVFVATTFIFAFAQLRKKRQSPMLLVNLLVYRAIAPRLTALMLVSAVLVTNVNAGLITNGSFESFDVGSDGGPGRSVYVAGTHTHAITGWTLSGVGDVYLHHTPAIGNTIGENFNFSQDGETYLDLSGGIGGGGAGRHATIFQDFATTTTQSYVLTFFSGAAFTSVAPTINVQVIGANPIFNQTIKALAPNPNINWMRHEFTFVADSNTTRLSFRDLSSSDDNVSFVDNVSVNPSVTSVPEPSSWVSVLSMSIALVFYRRRQMSKTKS